jgi:hypothetical protein
MSRKRPPKSTPAEPGTSPSAPPAGKTAQTLLHRLDRLAAVLFGDIPAPDIPPPTRYQQMRSGEKTPGGRSENYHIMGNVGWWVYAQLTGDVAEAALARKEVLDYFASERDEGLMRGEQGANSPHGEMHYAAHLLACYAGLAWKDNEMAEAGQRWTADFLATCDACAVDGRVYMPGFRVLPGKEPTSPVRDLIYQVALGRDIKLSEKKADDRFFLGAEIAVKLRARWGLARVGAFNLPRLKAHMTVERYADGGFLAWLDKIPVKGHSEQVVDWVLCNATGLEDFGRGWKRPRPNAIEKPVRIRLESA